MSLCSENTSKRAFAIYLIFDIMSLSEILGVFFWLTVSDPAEFGEAYNCLFANSLVICCRYQSGYARYKIGILFYIKLIGPEMQTRLGES
jgi:hypothetical protein